MTEVFRFSTDGLAPGDRLDAWRDRVWGRIGGADVSVPANKTFRASLLAGTLGSVQVHRIDVGPHRIRRTLPQARATGGQWLKIVFQLGGRLSIEQRHRRAELEPGQWCVYDVGEPCTAWNAEPVQLLAVLIARQALSSRVFDASAQLLRPVSWKGGVSQILHDSLRATCREFDSLSPQLSGELGGALLELAKLAMLEKMTVEGAMSSHDRLRDRILAFIEQHLHDPDLSLDMIARSLGCTKRYLHRVFSDGELTLNAFIRERRLARCGQDLLKPAFAGYSITQISYACGFSNSAHFSRVFREKFGMTPRAYRKCHYSAVGMARSA